MKRLIAEEYGVNLLEIYYDEKKKCFVKALYSIGLGDDDNHYYGASPINQHDVLKFLIYYGELDTVLHYFDELDVNAHLESVLMELQSERGFISPENLQNTNLMENIRCTYYQYRKDQFVVYVWNCYFVVESGESARVDFMAVRKLLEKPNTIVLNNMGWGMSGLHEAAKNKKFFECELPDS